MKAKEFSKRIRAELSAAGFPANDKERKKAFAKVFKVPRHMASSVLDGYIMPKDELLEDIARELQLADDWYKK